MKKLSPILIAVLFLAAFTGINPDIDGTWAGTVDGPNGQMEITYHFDAEGDTLTGTVETTMGKIDILNGKVDGNKFSFETEFNNGFRISHKGELKEDEILLEFKFEGNGPASNGPQTMTLTRVEE